MFGINISIESALYRNPNATVDLTKELGFDWKKEYEKETGIAYGEVIGVLTPVEEYFIGSYGGAEMLEVEEWIISRMTGMEKLEAIKTLYGIQSRVYDLRSEYRDVVFI